MTSVGGTKGGCVNYAMHDSKNVDMELSPREIRTICRNHISISPYPYGQ